MKRLVIAATAIAATLTLAACGNAPEQPAAETPAVTAPAAETPAAPAPAAETPAAPAVSGETVVPGTDMTVNQAMEAAQAQAASMTPEQKQAAVIQARTQAEAAAKAANMTDEQVKQTGDAAEAAAKQMLGVQ